MQLGPYSPALFVIPSGGQNIAAALDRNSHIVTVSNPAKRGQIVQLFGNGMGPVSNQPLSGNSRAFGTFRADNDNASRHYRRCDGTRIEAGAVPAA